MELHVWDGESKWGIPSMDLDSLQMLAYVKFTGAPVVIHKSSNPFSMNLPSFKCSSGIFTEFSDVSSYLRRNNYSCDYELSAKQCSAIIAYEQLLKSKLYPALMYLWWVEPKGYYDVIHKWFFKNIPFPYKFWYPGSFHKQNLALVTSLFDEDEEMKVIETEVHKQAQECLTLLSHRLGEDEYFFGNSPSTIDALIFSYLVLLLKVDLKVCALQQHIKACPNLSKFVSRIMQRYFTSVAHAEEIARKKDPTTSKDNELAIDDVPNKGRNFIISTLVASVAMVGYAISKGLVQVDIKENLHGYEDDKDYHYEGDYGEESDTDD